MPHLFTASWIDDCEDVCALAADTFDAWIAMKSEASYGLLEVSRHTSRSPDRVGLRACLAETLPDGTRQSTEVTATRCLDPVDDGAAGWLTVDVHRGGDGERDYLPSPWLVAQLIERGVRPRFGDDPLATTPYLLRGPAGGERLADWVTSFGRRLPLVVLAAVPSLFARLRRERSGLADIAAATARSCAGLGAVVLADETAVAHYNDAVGPGHSIGEGALRLFRPGADPAAAGDGRRHPHRPATVWYPYPEAAPSFAVRLLSADALTDARVAVSA